MADLVLNLTPPWGGDSWPLGPYVRPVLAVLAILIGSYLLIRLTHVLVRGVLRPLIGREGLESGAGPGGHSAGLTAAEIKKRQDTIEALVVNVVRFFVGGIAILMILQTVFALDIGPAVAGLGIVGIAVGLGTQNLVRDYLNGSLILMENQYSIGDVITIAGISGTVEDLTLRRTTLRDVEGTLHTVPNGQITIASNQTRLWSRVNLSVPVAYGTDVKMAWESVDEAGRQMASEAEWEHRILETPHVDRVGDLGDLGYTLLVQVKVAPGQQWAVAGELRKRILAGFARQGMEMPALTAASAAKTRRG